jgi:hypothetical protein
MPVPAYFLLIFTFTGVGSFWQYATTLWSYVRRVQLVDDHGSLTADQVSAMTAYLLHNGLV